MEQGMRAVRFEEGTVFKRGWYGVPGSRKQKEE